MERVQNKVFLDGTRWLALNKEIFELCINVLINLPFTMTSEQIDPSMIRVIKKNSKRDYEFEIIRNNHQECSFSLSGYPGEFDVNTLKNIKIKNKYMNGNYFIELFWGPTSVNPYNYQDKLW